MVFKGPAGFQRIVFVIMNVVVGICVSLALTVVVMGAPIDPVDLVRSIVLSFFVGYTVSDLVPGMAWGKMLAAKLGFPKGIVNHLISSAVLAFFMGTFILFFCGFINLIMVGGMPGVGGFFLMAYPTVLIVSFIDIVVFVPPSMKIAAAISGFDPDAASEQ